MNNKDQESFIKKEIVKVIEDNLELFRLNDNKLKKLKTYCRNNEDTQTSSISNDLLMLFTKEALNDLLNTDYLYDFRNLE